MLVSLPEHGRPRAKYRKCDIGLDVSAHFYHGLKAIDPDFHIVWHPYRVEWDNIINQYEGSYEDPRFPVNFRFGELNFGYVLTNRKKEPIPSNSWHIWRLCWPYGWGHIVKLESTDGQYLSLLLNRLKLQADWHDKYGFKSYNRLLAKTEEENREKLRKEYEETFGAWQEENNWLVRKAMENLSSGVVSPTDPTKDSIISYPGQGNRSRIVRPIDDEEGGLVS